MHYSGQQLQPICWWQLQGFLSWILIFQEKLGALEIWNNDFFLQLQNPEIFVPIIIRVFHSPSVWQFYVSTLHIIFARFKVSTGYFEISNSISTSLLHFYTVSTRLSISGSVLANSFKSSMKDRRWLRRALFFLSSKCMLILRRSTEIMIKAVTNKRGEQESL